MIELSGWDPEAGRFDAAVAGDTLNTAAYMTQLLPEERYEVSYVTVLGCDRYSDWMLSRIASLGVRTGLIARDPDRRPGVYAIETDPAGERRFHYWRADSAARQLAARGLVREEVLSRFDMVYLSGITLAILDDTGRAELLEACRAFRADGGRIAFDSNYRPALWSGPEAARRAMAAQWAECDVALPSLDDEHALWGEGSPQQAMSRIAGRSECEIAMKTGGPEVWLRSSGGEARQLQLPPAGPVVDTTAAGDAFNAGYLAARLGGDAPGDAAEAGHGIACQVIAKPGAIVSVEARTGPGGDRAQA